MSPCAVYMRTIKQEGKKREKRQWRRLFQTLFMSFSYQSTVHSLGYQSSKTSDGGRGCLDVDLKKGPLGTRWDKNAVTALLDPASCAFPSFSPSPQKQPGRRNLAVKSSPPVPQSSPPLLRYWSSNGAESDESGVRSFGQRAWGRGGGAHTLDRFWVPRYWGTPTEITTNTDTVTKQLCRGAIVKFSFLSLAFLFRS